MILLRMSREGIVKQTIGGGTSQIDGDHGLEITRFDGEIEKSGTG